MLKTLERFHKEIETQLKKAGLFDKVIPSFTWGMPSNRIQTYHLDKALDAAERMMKRRMVQLTEEDKKILAHIFLAISVTSSYTMSDSVAIPNTERIYNDQITTVNVCNLTTSIKIPLQDKLYIVPQNLSKYYRNAHIVVPQVSLIEKKKVHKRCKRAT